MGVFGQGGNITPATSSKLGGVIIKDQSSDPATSAYIIVRL